MLNIAICDDDIQELSRISNLISKYMDAKKITLRQEAFSNSAELLEAIRNKSFNILLIDILMPGIDGIKTAREIRAFDNEVRIIFLTSSPEFAVESYSVNAYYYLIKPGTAENLFPVLDKLILDLQRVEDFLYMKSTSGIMRIPFNRLEFIEVISKKLYFHLADGSVKEIYGSLSDFEPEVLCRKEFVKVHRSYIVNMGLIQELATRGLTTYSRKSVPISRLLYGQVREAYIQHLFMEKGVG